MSAAGQDESAGEVRWRALAERAVGAGFETLRSRTAEGLTLEPLYARAEDPAPQPWRGAARWSIAQRIDHPSLAAANHLAKLDLSGGADELALVVQASPYARGYGLPADPIDLDATFKAIDLDRVRLRVEAGPRTPAMLSALAALAQRQRLTSAAVAVDIGLDPFGWRACLGEGASGSLREVLDLRSGAGLVGTVFLADGRPWHEAGAGEAQELGTVLASAVAYLRQLTDAGVELEQAMESVAFLLPVDADVFLGLAKFRALRRLWSRVATASGLIPKPARVLAETSWRVMTRRDPWTNVMRAAAGVFAAGLGGADSICVLPFTLVCGLPDEAARRLARNLHHVFLDEAHLGRVADPAAGSGAFEAITGSLCTEAWSVFQWIESEGGMPAVLETGRLAARIATTAAVRRRDVGSLRHAIIGTSRYAVPGEASPAVLDVARHPSPAARDRLPRTRDAEPFEALVDRANRLGPDLAKVHLALLEAPARCGARLSFATTLFAAAGLAVEPSSIAEDNKDLIAAIEGGGARIVCLCGSDQAYAASARLIAEALRTAGAHRLLIVGPAGSDDFIDHAIFEGCEALRILGDVLDALDGEP